MKLRNTVASAVVLGLMSGTAVMANEHQKADAHADKEKNAKTTETTKPAPKADEKAACKTKDGCKSPEKKTH